MASPTDCTHNLDPLKLVRDGTSQEQRLSPALKPGYVAVNERKPEHGMVFAQAYAAFLKYYNANNVAAGDWKPFFSEDVSVQLAIAAVQAVEYYRQQVREYVDFLNDRQHQNDTAGLRDRLDYLFSCCATLSIRFNQLTEKLPGEIALKKSLQNLVQSQLAPALKRLIAYRKGGETIADAAKPINDNSAEKSAPLEILGGVAVKFSALGTANLSKDWTDGDDWTTYYSGIPGDDSVYGTPPGTTVFDCANHLATHNLFTSILDQFLKVYARTVSDAKRQLEDTFSKWDRHAPHYALFLAFLRLFEYARAEANTLTGRHLDLYYREILRLQEKPAEPGNAHLLVELAKHATIHEFKAGELFKAGKDDHGIEAFFANDRDFVANQAKVAALKTVYRHDTELVENPHIPAGSDTARLYASSIANSEDGQGAKLTSVDQSWHPFHNKIYLDGKLHEIQMPQAEVGFAIASHYLLMAEGTRTVTVDITTNLSTALTPDRKDDVVCLFTTEKGWLDKPVTKFVTESGVLRLTVEISSADPAITSYVSKTHGYTFDTHLPVFVLKLKHHGESPYIYSWLQDVTVTKVAVQVEVVGLKTLAVSNDFGPVDTSKPFQPFGASPVGGNSFIIGSKEIFQKTCTLAKLQVAWMQGPAGYKNKVVAVQPWFLKAGKWEANVPSSPIAHTSFDLKDGINQGVIDLPDDAANELYNTTSRHGFLRFVIGTDFGQGTYQTELQNYLIDKAQIFPPKNPAAAPAAPPTIPVIGEMSMSYTATQTIELGSTDGLHANRQAHYFHIAPFGQAEQHPLLKNAAGVSNVIYLVPQFYKNAEKKYDAELYVGVTGLKPPQNLALLFQVAEGTADPLSEKPDPHLHWSYLRGNEWIAFATSDVEDQTGGLLNSGIVTFAMPRDASDANTLLPTGMHWIRVAVASESDAVCRLILVVAQALEATFINKDNDPSFPAKVLVAGTITKLAQPDAAIKNLTQPFATFGGRGAELPVAFYTRISERLRHKDRAITLWDYERLILEAFHQIYKAKCLNHTRYEPTESGLGIYKELAPGHVTIVTIPHQQFHNLRDPLRPYTGLGLLEEIEAFLRQRLSCFVTLHVKNPQFEEVRVVCKVRLHDGVDETFHIIKLQEALTRFLSPWAFPGGGSPSFGGKIYKSVLINVVEEQPYVDYVTDFELFHVFRDMDGAQHSIEKNEVEGSKAVSILVSVPATQHSIQVIQPAEEETPGEQCPCEA